MIVTSPPLNHCSATSTAFMAAPCGSLSEIKRLNACSQSWMDSLPYPSRHAARPYDDRSSVLSSAVFCARPKLS